jgi:hypothetical protein
LILGTALAFLAAIPASAPAGQSAWSLSFGDAGSADLLREITAKASIDTSSAEPLSVEGPDGPMPEIASQQIPMAAGSPDAIPALKRACTDLGLAPPQADQLAVEPDTICTGMWRKTRVSVNASFQCSGSCSLFLETSAFDF